MPPPSARFISRMRDAAVIGIVTLFILIVFEGSASLLLVSKRLVFNSFRSSLENTHCRPDAELGWTNHPNVALSNYYGEGTYVKTNSLGFRNEREFSRDVDEGNLRILCSGDSFTFGYGVSNDKTWCHLLEANNPGIETVNLGQVGYGVDQSYLLYRREGGKLAHQIHLFAFIYDDFDRMTKTYFSYFKPLLLLKDGKIVVTHTPVPTSEGISGWFQRNIPIFASLRFVELANKFRAPSASGEPLSDLKPLTLALFDDLEKLSAERSSKLVFVYLPDGGDMQWSGLRTMNATDPRRVQWREFLKSELDRRGRPFIDLTDDFNRPSPLKGTLFGTDGHYSMAGNAFVAERLTQQLSKVGLIHPSGIKRRYPAPKERSLSGQ